jgi:NADPH:quinone reductase-like Zn-dependent oxidoreductase
VPANAPIMRAVIQDGYGAPERVLRLEEIPVPSIGADDVLIRMRATSVNTPDWATVTGVPYILRLGSGLRRPKRPVRGSDVAGVVEAVGQRVTDLAAGDEVLGSTRAQAGAFAQYVVAPAAQLVRKPARLTFTDAAASVMTGLAALVAMRDVAQAGAGTRVLINGASGGVGTMAVQIAKVLVRKSPAYAVPATSNWSGRSGRTTSSTTRRRTSPRADRVSTSSSTTC